MREEIYEQMATSEKRHWWFAGRRALAHALLENALKGVAGTAQILEAGAGSGGNLKMLSRLGHVSAFEPHEQSRQIASRTSGNQVVHGSLPDDVPYAPETFHAVTAFDVLEHVEDDEGAMQKLLEVCQKGGVLVATVPAHMWLWGAHDTWHHHFRRYSKDEFRTKLEAAGWTVEKLGYYNGILGAAGAGARLVSKNLGHKGIVGSSVPPEPINAALEAILRAENRLARAGALPWGMSLFTVARKL